MSTKPLILFDIDKTLIDTDALRLLQRETLAQALGVSSQDIADRFMKYYGTLKDTSDFAPSDFLPYLSRTYQTSLENLREVFFAPLNFQKVLYPDVVEVLSHLRNQGYTLGLYSQGDQEFQEHKMLANNLLTFFEKPHRHIMREKMDPSLIENLPENTVIIDDRVEVVQFLEQFPNAIPVRMVRDASSPLGYYTISSLRDLFPILDGLSDA